MQCMLRAALWIALAAKDVHLFLQLKIMIDCLITVVEQFKLC